MLSYSRALSCSLLMFPQQRTATMVSVGVIFVMLPTLSALRQHAEAGSMRSFSSLSMVRTSSRASASVTVEQFETFSLTIPSVSSATLVAQRLSQIEVMLVSVTGSQAASA